MTDVVDRAALTNELERVRGDFHLLLAIASDDDWDKRALRPPSAAVDSRAPEALAAAVGVEDDAQGDESVAAGAVVDVHAAPVGFDEAGPS
jgi:hypothetical protein